MSERKAKRKTISIFGRQDNDDRAMFDRLQDLVYGSGKVDAEALQKNLTNFLQAMQDVIQNIPETLGEFKLDAVTLTAEVSAKGTVSLLGTGGEVAGKGGLSFTLRRS